MAFARDGRCGFRSRQVLLQESGAYCDDMVDVLFGETARDQKTQWRSVALSAKLSEKDAAGAFRCKPKDLTNYGRGLKFRAGAVIAFPISVLLSTGKSDFHYSCAVYHHDTKIIYHADSLDTPRRSHSWLVENELAQFLMICGGLAKPPTRQNVPCPKQGPTNHCGPAAVTNNRRIQALLLGSGPPPSSRLKVTYAAASLKQVRQDLKGELMHLASLEADVPFTDDVWDDFMGRPMEDVAEAAQNILENLDARDMAMYGFGVSDDPNERMDLYGLADAIASAQSGVATRKGRSAVFHPHVGVLSVAVLDSPKTNHVKVEIEHWLTPRTARVVVAFDALTTELEWPLLKGRIIAAESGDALSELPAHVLHFQVCLAHLIETARTQVGVA